MTANQSRTTFIKLRSPTGEYLYVSGTIDELLQHITASRGSNDVYLGVELVGCVHLEFLHGKTTGSRSCWRWVGYLTDGTTEVEGSASTTKMATARAVARAFLETRMTVDKTWTEVHK